MHPPPGLCQIETVLARKVDMQNLDEQLEQARMRRRLPEPSVRRLLRAKAGVSQEAIAAEVGCSRELVARWETGERNPGGRLLPAYVEVLDRLAGELTQSV